MNKFSKELTEYLINLFTVCHLCEIDDIVIEKQMVRGHTADAKRGIFIMEYDNIPDISFTGMGIRGVKTLKSRMSILDEDNMNITFDIKEKDNGDNIVKKMMMTSKKTKIE